MICAVAAISTATAVFISPSHVTVQLKVNRHAHHSTLFFILVTATVETYININLAAGL